MAKLAVIGAGLIGRAWAIVFLRGGHDVALWDPDPQAAPAARDFIAERLPELQAVDLLAGATPEALLRRLMLPPTLAQAVADTEHVQENGPERVPEKQALFAQLDAAAPPDAVLASSTSTIPASRFTEALSGRARCLVAHPVNPPYLVPVVELCPAPWTDPAAVARTRTLMTAMGMVPATVNHEIPGFLLNRLQAALLGEAFRLVADGVATQEDIDATVKHGLGLRWAFMGPFETIDLNAPGGLADYCARYGRPLHELQEGMKPREWTGDLVERLDADRRLGLPKPKHAERQAWRDRRLMALLQHKTTQPE